MHLSELVLGVCPLAQCDQRDEQANHQRATPHSPANSIELNSALRAVAIDSSWRVALIVQQ